MRNKRRTYFGEWLRHRQRGTISLDNGGKTTVNETRDPKDSTYKCSYYSFATIKAVEHNDLNCPLSLSEC
jgi:hypothetical protein